MTRFPLLIFMAPWQAGFREPQINLLDGFPLPASHL